MRRILVSACLMGQPVRYDGRAKTLAHRLLSAWQVEGRLVPFCPELAGGFAVPRLPAEIEPDATGADVLDGRARVWDSNGADVTAGFVAGAQAAAKAARAAGCSFALLTEASPSCGTALLYDGQFAGQTRAGQGVTAAALHRAGIACFAPGRIAQLAKALAAGA